MIQARLLLIRIVYGSVVVLMKSAKRTPASPPPASLSDATRVIDVGFALPNRSMSGRPVYGLSAMPSLPHLSPREGAGRVLRAF